MKNRIVFALLAVALLLTLAYCGRETKTEKTNELADEEFRQVIKLGYEAKESKANIKNGVNIDEEYARLDQIQKEMYSIIRTEDIIYEQSSTKNYLVYRIIQVTSPTYDYTDGENTLEILLQDASELVK